MHHNRSVRKRTSEQIRTACRERAGTTEKNSMDNERPGVTKIFRDGGQQRESTKCLLAENCKMHEDFDKF